MRKWLSLGHTGSEETLTTFLWANLPSTGQSGNTLVALTDKALATGSTPLKGDQTRAAPPSLSRELKKVYLSVSL